MKNFKLSNLLYSLSSYEFYITYINRKAINLANSRYTVSVVDLKRDMIVSNIPQLHQNGKYLLWSIFNYSYPYSLHYYYYLQRRPS